MDSWCVKFHPRCVNIWMCSSIFSYKVTVPLQLLAFGFWLLVKTFWLLAFGFWLLAFGENLLQNSFCICINNQYKRLYWLLIQMQRCSYFNNFCAIFIYFTAISRFILIISPLFHGLF